MKKPTKWVCTQRRLESAWASAQSDQSSLCAQWVTKDPSFLHADSEDSDQTGWMPRLIWVFAGHTAILLDLSCRGSIMYTVKILNPKNSDARKICCNYPKGWTVWFDDRVMSPKDADGMANSVDPVQTAPVGRGSALFAQAYLFGNLNVGSLR